ncbi:MAG: hypothetical protein AB7O38_19875, partial [Pirellulaceae bacterium]
LAVTPHSHVVLNNLAWVLAHQPEPDLEQALKLADEAVEIAPANADVRETRGQILTKLERWPEALADLEVALGYLQGNVSLHRSVATIYERLGNSSMARRHRDLADEAERARDGKAGASGEGAKAPPDETDDKATKPPLAEPLPEVEPPPLPSSSSPSSLGRDTPRPRDEVSCACGCSSFSLHAAWHREVQARPA